MEIKRFFFETVTVGDIQLLEEKIEHKLPSDYISFLVKYNGGAPSPNLFLINEKEKEDSVSMLYGITEKKSYDLWRNFALSLGEIPQAIMPIGEDPGGNFICIGILPENSGTIFFLDHETNNVIAIAKNIDNFLDSLYEVNKFN
jgi:cell wall assembly regulator SMI1